MLKSIILIECKLMPGKYRRESPEARKGNKCYVQQQPNLTINSNHEAQQIDINLFNLQEQANRRISQ